MNAVDSFIALRARYVFPVVGPPIEWGVVTLHGDKIIAVGKASDVAVTDLGNVAIVPGFVNAHTHLEFSDLEAPLGELGEPLPAWIRRVIAYRRAQVNNSDEAIRGGVDQSLAAGVTAIGDIVTSPPRQVSTQLLRVHFHEVISLDARQIDDVLEATEERIDASGAPAAFEGISPHAPYTVHPSLFGPLVELAGQLKAPISVHLAESPEEMELLRTGTGPFRELLEELGVWRDDANPVGLRPLHYLRLMCDAPRALVVHGNYLDEEEIEFIGRRRGQLGIAYCPRTHAFFGHVPYPLESMMRKGATVCVGTDSRASNPDLNLLEELKFIFAHHATRPSAILQMGTLNGANMLFDEGVAGTIEAHRRADLAVIELPERESADPHELLFSDEARVVQTWCEGRPV